MGANYLKDNGGFELSTGDERRFSKHVHDNVHGNIYLDPRGRYALRLLLSVLQRTFSRLSLPSSNSRRRLPLWRSFTPATTSDITGMSRQVAAPGKRKRPGPDPAALSSDEQIVLDVIMSKEGSGITDKEAKWQIKTIPMPSVTKAIKSLKAKNLIKEVKSHGGKKIIMGASFTPSVQISGGIWYNEGKMDYEFVDALKKACSGYLKKNKVATLEAIHKFMEGKVSTEPVPQEELAKLLEMMVLSNEVVEVKSTGFGEFSRIRVGETCYKLLNAAGARDASTPITGAFASIPCGMCPRRDMCTPDGVISPSTCVYYTKWLDISF